MMSKCNRSAPETAGALDFPAEAGVVGGEQRGCDNHALSLSEEHRRRKVGMCSTGSRAIRPVGHPGTGHGQREVLRLIRFLQIIQLRLQLEILATMSAL